MTRDDRDDERRQPGIDIEPADFAPCELRFGDGRLPGRGGRRSAPTLRHPILPFVRRVGRTPPEVNRLTSAVLPKDRVRNRTGQQ